MEKYTRYERPILRAEVISVRNLRYVYDLDGDTLMKIEKVYCIQSTDIQRVQEDNGTEILKVGVTLMGTPQKVYDPLRRGERVCWHVADGWDKPAVRKAGHIVDIYPHLGTAKVYEDGWADDPQGYRGVNVPLTNLRRLRKVKK